MDFIAWGRSRRDWSDSTCTTYRYWTGRADRWLRTHLAVTLARARADHLIAWWDHLPDDVASRNQARNAVCGFYAAALDLGRRATNPSDTLPSLRVPEHLPEALTAVQASKVRVAAAERGLIVAALIAVLIHAGLRREETRTLGWSQVADGYLRVRGKGSKDRVVPANRPLADTLGEWRMACPDTRWCFPSTQQPGPYSASWINTVVRQVGNAAGIDGLYPHMLRATFGTMMLERGVDIRKVQELMGHRRISTTQQYLAVRPTGLRSAVETLDDV